MGLSLLPDRPRPTTRFHFSGGPFSRLRNASTISSNSTGCLEPGGRRKVGCDSTAQASDAQEDKIARFSSSGEVRVADHVMRVIEC